MYIQPDSISSTALISVSTGTKGRFRNSNLEFEIVRSGGSQTSIIRFRDSREEHEVLDIDLRSETEEGWTEKQGSNY